MFDQIAEALAHQARRDLLALLDETEAIGMGALARAIEVSPATLNHHVGILERAGLVARVRCGRVVLVESIGSVEIVVHRRS